MEKKEISHEAAYVLANLDDAHARGVNVIDACPGAMVRTHVVSIPEVRPRLRWIGVDFADGYQWEAIFHADHWGHVRRDLRALFLRRGL